jgi:hypothetical protein
MIDDRPRGFLVVALIFIGVLAFLLSVYFFSGPPPLPE